MLEARVLVTLGGCTGRGHEGAFWEVRNILYLDQIDSVCYMGLYIYKI